jgi:hypothetical protein
MRRRPTYSAFERAIIVHRHLLAGKPLTTREVMRLTGASLAAAKRTMTEIERVLPVETQVAGVTRRRTMVLARRA